MPGTNDSETGTETLTFWRNIKQSTIDNCDVLLFIDVSNKQAKNKQINSVAVNFIKLYK